MNRILLLIGIALSSLFVQGQTNSIDTAAISKNKPDISSHPSSNKLYRYSIGLKVFKMEQFPKILNEENPTDFTNLYFNTVFAKVNDNQINYRFTGSFYNNNIKFVNECVDCEIVTGKLTDFTVKTGFEKVLSYATIQPYFGFDIGFRKNRFKGSSENASLVPYSEPYDVIAEKNGGLLSPLLGLNLNVVNHLTVGVEASMEMLFNYERQEKTSKGETREQSFRSDRNWEFLIRPVAVSLQYNFGISD